MSKLLRVALLLSLAGCDAPAMSEPRDDAGETRDASTDGPLLDTSNALDAGRADAMPVDAGPDTRVSEDCAATGDEDGDRLADCDDSECWSGCAAEHVGRELSGLTECSTAILRTAEESRASCLAYDGDPGDAPTTCAGGIALVATVRFFCDAAGDTRAVWLDEHLTLPMSTTRGMPPSYESISYEYASVRDLIRLSSPSGSGSTAPVVQLQEGGMNPRLVTVVPVAPDDTALVRLLGVQRVTEAIAGDPPRIVSTTRELFRAGVTSVVLP